VKWDSYGQYRMTRLDSGFGLEGQIYVGMKIFDRTILRYPSSGTKSLFDLKFPLFSLPGMSAQVLTNPITACQPAIIQGSTTDGVNNPFDESSILWATYPTDAAIVANGINPLQAEFIPPVAGDYKVFFIGKGEALGNIARQFETLEVTVQEGGSSCLTLTVTKGGSGSGTVTSQPAGINCGSTCSSSFATDQAITLAAQPYNGSTFSGWSGAGCSGIGVCNLTLDASKAVTAQFDLGGEN
jgi:hypothetical protein